MSANTETTGAPPKGYMKCGKKCGRYAGVGNWCWECRAKERPIDDDEREVTMLQYPDWTPPIAAPAAHVERRKGQRWKWERNGIAWVCELISGSGYAWNARGCGGYTGEGFLVEADWTGSAGATMTLLADAPTEPAKCGMPLLNGHTCALNAGHDNACSMWRTEVAKSPPVQEAPKAAPLAMCERCTSIEEVRDTRFDSRSRAYCAPCRQELEAWTAAQKVGKPYAGPERLPKPQLAADWVEDCLGDVR